YPCHSRMCVSSFCDRAADHRALHSFPTRRSSDLVGAATEKRRSHAEVVADLPAANAASLAATPDLNADTAVQLTTLTELPPPSRSEEHTSELQSRENLVCRLLLEKKKKEN